jgi:non-ribosomal peptide synthetase component F
VSVDTAKFDLTLQLIERPDGSLDGLVEYATALFDRVTAERLAGHYLQLLRAIEARPQERIAQLQMLSDSERQQLLERTDEADRPDADVTAIELIQAQVRRSPAAIAVVSRGAADRPGLPQRADRLPAHRCRRAARHHSAIAARQPCRIGSHDRGARRLTRPGPHPGPAS